IEGTPRVAFGATPLKGGHTQRPGGFGAPPASPAAPPPSRGAHPEARQSRFLGCPGLRHFAPTTALTGLNPMKSFRVCFSLAVLIGIAVSMPLTVQASAPEPTVSAALQGKQGTNKVRLRVWGFEVYDARLFTVSGFKAEQFADHRFGLELSYLRSFKGNDIAER